MTYTAHAYGSIIIRFEMIVSPAVTRKRRISLESAVYCRTLDNSMYGTSLEDLVTIRTETISPERETL